MRACRKFPVRNICGSWKSNFRSPSVEVFRDGKRFFLALVYHPDAVILNRIFQTDKGLFVDLLQEVRITYDEEKDILCLSTEGEYIRADEH